MQTIFSRSSKHQLTLQIFGVVTVLSIGLSSCAQQQTVDPPTGDGHQWGVLNSQVEVLEEQIESLRSDIVALEAHISASQKTKKKVRAVKIKKFEPGKEVKRLAQEETIADSSHESMYWYFSGIEEIKKSNYDKAIRAFRHFLQMNPDHVYADRAQYLISESYYRNKEFALVLVATDAFESQYPYSFKLPDIHFKRAESYIKLGSKKRAKDALRHLMSQYPTHPLAASAATKLGQLDVESKTAGKKIPKLLN